MAGHIDSEQFWIDGAAHARNIAATFAAYGVVLAEQGTTLAWGCGRGRVIRHCSDMRGPAVFGSDYNPQLVQWCQRNLPFADVRKNELDPPLPFESDTFDALSRSPCSHTSTPTGSRVGSPRSPASSSLAARPC